MASGLICSLASQSAAKSSGTKVSIGSNKVSDAKLLLGEGDWEEGVLGGLLAQDGLALGD